MVSNAERLVGIAERYDRQLEGLDRETLKRISEAYDISYRTLVDQLRDAYPRLQEAGSVSSLVQQGAIAAELREALEFINPGNTEEYRRLGETVIQQSSDLGQRLAGDSLKRLGVQSTFTTIPLDAVRFQAERFTKSLVNYSNRQAGQISAVVEQGLVQGWGVRKTEQGLKALGVSFKSNAETIARTEIQSAYVNSSMARYEKSGIDKVIWIATPSDRLCSYCAAKNGLMYRSKDVVFPPHPRCRCVTLPSVGLTAEDADYYKSYREETLQELKDAGGKPDSGLTPFEKAAGLTSPPKPVWEPGNPLPKDVTLIPRDTQALMSDASGDSNEVSRIVSKIQSASLTSPKVKEIWDRFESERNRLEKNGILPGAGLDEQAAIRAYTSKYYGPMNKVLRGHEIDIDDDVRAAFTDLSRLAEIGLQKLEPYRGTVYRGAEMSERRIATYVPGAIVSDDGFFSTSYSVSESFSGNTQYVIESKTGINIESIARYEEEKEVLFPPGSQFTILKVERAGKSVVVYMQEK